MVARVFLAAAVAALAGVSAAGGVLGAGQRGSVRVPALLTYVRVNAPLSGFHLCTAFANGAHARAFGRRYWAPGGTSWSPDGRNLAFMADTASAGYYGSPHNTDIFIASERGAIVRNLTKRFSNANVFDPAWSPNGRWIAFTAEGGAVDPAVDHIWVVRPDGSRFRNLYLDGDHPAWSPDGRRLAYVSWVRSLDEPLIGGIFVARANGSGAHLVIRNGSTPAWSPDGRTIAYGAPTVRGSGMQDIFLAHADGSNQQNLTNTPDADEWPAGWSPGGKFLAFTRTMVVADRVSVEARVMRADGSGDHLVAEDAAASSWRPPAAFPKTPHRSC